MGLPEQVKRASVSSKNLMSNKKRRSSFKLSAILDEFESVNGIEAEMEQNYARITQEKAERLAAEQALMEQQKRITVNVSDLSRAHSFKEDEKLNDDLDALMTLTDDDLDDLKEKEETNQSVEQKEDMQEENENKEN